jgi:hypothetical protein
VNDCLGLNKPAAQRTPEQARRVRTIVDVVRIPESAIIGHLNTGTYTYRDIAQRTGASPFGNESVRYVGSDDDAALNAGVRRYRADPAAAARFAADIDYAGRFAMPVLTTALVEGNDTLRQRMDALGSGSRLVQTFVDSNQHSYWGDAMYPPLFEALLNWVDKGVKPDPASIAARCQALRATTPADCKFAVDYTVKPLASRIPPR